MYNQVMYLIEGKWHPHSWMFYNMDKTILEPHGHHKVTAIMVLTKVAPYESELNMQMTEWDLGFGLKNKCKDLL